MDGLGDMGSEWFNSFTASERNRSDTPFYESCFQNLGVFSSLETSPAEHLGDRMSDSFRICIEANRKDKSSEFNEFVQFPGRVGDGRKNSGLLHCQITRIREEDSLIGGDIRWEFPSSKAKHNKWPSSSLSSSSSFSYKRLQSDLQLCSSKRFKDGSS